MSRDIDILMITHKRPAYTRLALRRLLDTCDDSMRVWVWHNGSDEETLEVCRSFRDHPRFFKFQHSLENVKLMEPTNWLWSNSSASYVGKVDDDCLVPFEWGDAFRRMHEAVPNLGVVACWHFPLEDFDMGLAAQKIRELDGEYKILSNCWVCGSGYVMKRRCIERHGLLRKNVNWTKYCLRLAAAGWELGWFYPLLCQEHMDDPRAPHTMLKTQMDIEQHLPLSAKCRGIRTLEEWTEFLKRDARIVQMSSTDPKYYFGWRKLLRNALARLSK